MINFHRKNQQVSLSSTCPPEQLENQAMRQLGKRMLYYPLIALDRIAVKNANNRLFLLFYLG